MTSCEKCNVQLKDHLGKTEFANQQVLPQTSGTSSTLQQCCQCSLVLTPNSCLKCNESVYRKCSCKSAVSSVGPLCFCCGEKKRNLKLEQEIIHYMHNRYGIPFAEWLQAILVGRFKCIDPEAQRGHEFGVWGCKIDAGQLSTSTQNPELEGRAVEYTQNYMGDTFADFLNRVFNERYQHDFVDGRSGKDMIVILTKPLYLLMEIDDKTSAGLTVVPFTQDDFDDKTSAGLPVLPFTEDDLSRPGVFLPKGSPNAQEQSSEATCSHNPCADCGRVLTTNTCLQCNLRMCRKCSSRCKLCRQPLCAFCVPIYRHVCLPQKLLPSLDD